MQKKGFAIALSLFLAAALFFFGLQAGGAWLPAALPMAAAGGEEAPIQSARDDELEVFFSHSAGFYAKGFALSLSADAGDAFLRENDLSRAALANASIYYTLDGSEPSRETGILYEGPISLAGSEGDVQGIAVRARAYCGDVAGRVATGTYFISADIDKRFDEVLVFAITSEPEGLYGYEDGILVPGKLYDDYVGDEESDLTIATAEVPANYQMRGRESEREANVQVFDAAGNLLLSQDAGVRVQGNWTRFYSQKSLRLVARKEYDGENGKFKYPFFEENTVEGKPWQVVEEYDELVLRNSGQDFGGAYVRDALNGQLARDAGLSGTQYSRPAAVFINGEYYGLAWLQSRFSEKDLQTKWDTADADFQIVGVQLAAGGVFEGEGEAADGWMEAWAYSEKDLTNDAVFARFESLVDSESFLQLIAFYVSSGCYDFYSNNVKAYRYTGEGAPVGSEVADGRWRFLLYDTDYSWGLDAIGAYDQPAISWIMGKMEEEWSADVTCKLFIRLMEREDMRAVFLNLLSDDLAGPLAAQNVQRRLSAYTKDIENELRYALPRHFNDRDMGYVQAQQEEIVTFARQRGEAVNADVQAVFGIGEEKYTVSVAGCEGASVQMGGQTLTGGGRLRGRYYTENEVRLRAQAQYGYVFSHWLVDGKIAPGEEICVPAGDAGQTVQVQVVVVEMSPTQLTLTEVAYTGSGDWIEIHNPMDAAVDLSGYRLYEENADVGTTLQGLSIAAGAYMVIACDNADSAALLGLPMVGFSLKKGEVLVFTAPGGEEIARLEMEGAEEGESLAFDFEYGAFRPAAQPTPGAANVFTAI